MQSLTLDVIMHAVFGVEEGPRQEELKRRVRAMLDPVGNRAAILLMMLSGGRMGVTGRMERFARQRRAVDEIYRRSQPGARRRTWNSVRTSCPCFCWPGTRTVRP